MARLTAEPRWWRCRGSRGIDICHTASVQRATTEFLQAASRSSRLAEDCGEAPKYPRRNDRNLRGSWPHVPLEKGTRSQAGRSIRLASGARIRLGGISFAAFISTRPLPAVRPNHQPIALASDGHCTCFYLSATARARLCRPHRTPCASASDGDLAATLADVRS